jgi:hypothetical protein
MTISVLRQQTWFRLSPATNSNLSKLSASLSSCWRKWSSSGPYADCAQQVRFRLVPLIWWQADLKEAALWSKGNN